LRKFDVNMDQGEANRKRYKRIYDSKYKIPAASKLSKVEEA